MKFHVDMENTYTWIISMDSFVKVCVEMEKPRVPAKDGLWNFCAGPKLHALQSGRYSKQRGQALQY